MRCATPPSRTAFTYGPDPSTHSRCTVGGMVANNACGSHSVAFGTAAENLVDVTIMLADGREVTFSEGGCDDPEIDAQLKALVEDNAALIDAEPAAFHARCPVTVCTTFERMASTLPRRWRDRREPPASSPS